MDDLPLRRTDRAGQKRETQQTLDNIPRCDFHIHTKHLGCANGTMEVPAIVKEAERLGLTSIGITDHLNSLDRLPLHAPIRREIEELDTRVSVSSLPKRALPSPWAPTPTISGA